VDVVATFATDSEAAELMQPTDRAFHNPAVNTQATAVRGIAFSQHGFDVALAELPSVRLRVVSPVALDALGAAARSSPFATHRRNGVNHRQQLRNVVPIGGRQRGREGNAGRIGGQMMFAAGFAAICRIGSRFFPPCMARTDDESTITRDQSILSAPCKWASNAWWIFCQTPFLCQACKRRQAVIPLPQPSSCGKYSQGRPVLSTNRIALSTLRLSIGLRPGNRLRRFFGGGNSGSIIFHNSSSRIGFAMAAPPCAAKKITALGAVT